MQQKIKDPQTVNEQYGVEDFDAIERNTRDLDDLVDGFWIQER